LLNQTKTDSDVNNNNDNDNDNIDNDVTNDLGAGDTQEFGFTDAIVPASAEPEPIGQLNDGMFSVDVLLSMLC
jgi:hypothetical protein